MEKPKEPTTTTVLLPNAVYQIKILKLLFSAHCNGTCTILHHNARSHNFKAENIIPNTEKGDHIDAEQRPNIFVTAAIYK